MTKDLDFWKQCETFKAKFQELEDMAKLIFDTYLEVSEIFICWKEYSFITLCKLQALMQYVGKNITFLRSAQEEITFNTLEQYSSLVENDANLC